MNTRKLRLVDEAGPPEVEAGELLVAFATDDMKTVDAHFNGARNFAVYAVGPEANRFVEAIQFEGDPAPKGENGARVAARIEAIKECSLLFVGAIGGPSAARVVSSRIHPVKARPDEPIKDILERLQEILRTSPPPWLRKALRKDKPRDFSFLDDDDE